ncbi:glycosyltransferase family 4 protein [Brevundimonas sp. FT23042]|uniref:glycosyltransferase family 4 protein n=1 Tax=Brevundimonas sp. FT23042 TaxID=3393749 RepID=UPI003B586BFA
MIVFAHLLNDRSGSPRVLKTVIEGLPQEPGKLFIGSEGDGFLSDVDRPRQVYWYRRSRSRVFTLCALFVSQLSLGWKLLSDRTIPRDAVLYVNTLLPFGAALYGRLTGRAVVYHVHEASIRPSAFRALLVGIAKFTATRLIYVSKAHRRLLPIAEERSTTVYNAIDPELAAKAARPDYAHRRQGPFTVLMLTYARDYKGVPEFLALASRLAHREEIAFQLVLSDLAEGGLPPDHGANVRVLAPTNDPSPYYVEADLVMNLSRPDLCTETFGLTLLEAMAFGVPVIAPPVGGPTELVSDGESGFLIDCRNQVALAATVERLVDDAALHERMSKAARTAADQYSLGSFLQGISSTIEDARLAVRTRSCD